MTPSQPDLSFEHEPLTSLFATERSTESFRLDESQVESFRARGFLSPVRVLTEEQVGQLLDELEPILDPSHSGHELFYEFHANESPDPGRVLVHALGAWRVATAFHDLIWNVAITVPASQLLGGPVRLWHDQLFVKPERHGGVVAWHQDYSYWTRTKPMGHVTCWIPLDDVDESNGCVQYVPGSHRWDLLPVTGLTSEMNAIEAVLPPAQKQAFVPEPMRLKKGVASFHHPLTIHGSFGNDSARPRRAIALNYCLDGVRSDSDEPLLSGVELIARGSPLSGRFFPLVYSP